jgi:hypothetical protein
MLSGRSWYCTDASTCLVLLHKQLSIQSEGCSQANSLQMRKDLWTLLYTLSYFITAQQAFCCVPAVKLLTLKRTPNRDECFPLFIVGMDTQTPRSDFTHTLSTFSWQQNTWHNLACWQITKDIPSHTVHSCRLIQSCNRLFPGSTGRCVKVAKNIYCVVKEWVMMYGISL